MNFLLLSSTSPLKLQAGRFYRPAEVKYIYLSNCKTVAGI
ncbi:hypothetical protein MTY_1810 [Moorella thermoacetica Y72]|uniref:Uncharacterized protein n=1 Tax=Moorella thermoacetica Y72 TaxID=1325331 RepID=A0A0S6UG99_NEOTH|nr:hypothetical protein MTY_1810 [Moorella thermoacetica Y72]